MPTAKEVTYAHVNRVSELLGEAAIELIKRGARHDRSKFEPVELDPLQRMQDLIDKEGQAPYGTDEYRRRTALLGEMLAHHYAHNTHHPEHYRNSVAGMDLFDLIEMFFDWKAASERGEESEMNLSYSINKLEMPSMLESILRNTADRLGYKTK